MHDSTGLAGFQEKQGLFRNPVTWILYFVGSKGDPPMRRTCSHLSHSSCTEAGVGLEKHFGLKFR